MEVEDLPLTLALGILSSAIGETFARRRHVLRNSWLSQPSATVRAHIVLRCGALDAQALSSVRQENETASDLLCAPVPAVEGRRKGPVQALFYWLQYAHARYPRASFIAKADDDVYLHLPDIETHLSSIPRDSAPYAYYGSMVYFRLFKSAPQGLRPGQYKFHSFGSTAKYSRGRGTYPGCPDEAKSAASGPSPGGTPHCSGPMPFACGPFFAVGHAAIAAVLRAREGIEGDLRDILALPDSHEKILEDAWMGSVLWRYVGGHLPIQIYAVSKPLYVDDAAHFKHIASNPSLMIWHNRLKYVVRVAVLHAYHTARHGRYHCTAPISWRRLRKHCCGNLDRRGRPSLATAGSRANATGHVWPLMYAVANHSACAKAARRGRARNLLWKPLWPHWGIELSQNVSMREQA